MIWRLWWNFRPLRRYSKEKWRGKRCTRFFFKSPLYRSVFYFPIHRTHPCRTIRDRLLFITEHHSLVYEQSRKSPRTPEVTWNASSSSFRSFGCNIHSKHVKRVFESLPHSLYVTSSSIFLSTNVTLLRKVGRVWTKKKKKMYGLKTSTLTII